MKQRHGIETALNSLRQKGCIYNYERKNGTLDEIDFKYKKGKLIEFVSHKKQSIDPAILHMNNAEMLGNKSWGKFDFLVKKGIPVRGLDVYRKKQELERVE